jgi:CheY-like chemotaxis protein
MVRKRKFILVCDSDPVNLAVLKIVIETRGPFIVTQAECAYDAIEHLRFGWYFVLVTNLKLLGSGGDELAARVKQVCPYVNTIVYSEQPAERPRRGLPVTSDNFFRGSLTSPALLLDAVKIAARRKRGPKKGFSLHSLYRTARRAA